MTEEQKRIAYTEGATWEIVFLTVAWSTWYLADGWGHSTLATFLGLMWLFTAWYPAYAGYQRMKRQIEKV